MTKLFLTTYFLSLILNGIFYWILDIQKRGDKDEKISYILWSSMPLFNIFLAGYVGFSLLFSDVMLFMYKRKIDYQAWIIRENSKIDANFIKKHGLEAYIEKQKKELDYLSKHYH